MSESNIELRIQNLERRLKISENSAERAEIVDKIKDLKTQLKKIGNTDKNPEATTHIDAPVVADRLAGESADLKLERGQIMNSGNSYSVGI